MQHGQPLQQSHLQVETDLKAVTKVLLWFEAFTSPLLTSQLQSQCQLAFVEGFTNAVRHAHKHLPQSTPIELEVTLFTNYIEMRIWDWGQPFDLQAKLQSLCQEELDPLEQEGGRGLMFMHQLMDEVSYVRLPDQRNCLLLRKNL